MFIYIFIIFYSPGEGPVPSTYSAEVFPLSHREVGMGWTVATCLFWASVLIIFLQLMLDAMGATGVFGFYAGTNIIALIIIFLWVPDTKQRTLKELDYIFAVSTRTHIRYQLNKALPWRFSRWGLQSKNAVLEPSYHFDHSTDQSRIDAMMPADKGRADQKAENGSGSGIQFENNHKDTTSSTIQEKTGYIYCLRKDG